MSCNCSQPFAHSPKMNPNKLKVTAVVTRNAIHPKGMQNLDGNENRCRDENHQAEHDGFRGRCTDVRQYDFGGRYGGGQDFVDRTHEFREVDAEGRIRHALGEKREHDEARHDERAVADAIHGGHARADGRTEYHEIQRGADDRRHQALH